MVINKSVAITGSAKSVKSILTKISDKFITDTVPRRKNKYSACLRVLITNSNICCDVFCKLLWNGGYERINVLLIE